MVLYHICRAGDEGNFSKGYIGVTSNFQKRMLEHRGYGNRHLKNAFNKYDDVVNTLITSGSQDEMLEMEEWLRPSENIGWNIAKGGGLPPTAKKGHGLGRVPTEYTRELIGNASAGRSHSEITKALQSELAVKREEAKRTNTEPYVYFDRRDRVAVSTRSKDHRDKVSKSQSGQGNSNFKGWYMIDGTKYAIREAVNVAGVSATSVRARCHNSNFPNYIFIPKESL